VAQDFRARRAANLKDLRCLPPSENIQNSTYPDTPAIRPRRIFRRIFLLATYREWLARLGPHEPISLYLHVPFCKQMCWYCGCNMKLAARYSPVATYVRHVLAEIDLIADALPALMPVSHLHFGGGTPTVLESDYLAAIMARRAARRIDRSVAHDSLNHVTAQLILPAQGVAACNR
jgi:coproporphyrinogen III oxidase-like Fe-S oxidoreductase